MAFRSIALLAVCCSMTLLLSLNGQSLWTDEAFSAWLASHETFRGFCSSLYTGDSSDLQMALYYAWLFVWGRVFGTGELALRAANIPFLLAFSFALVWTSARIFGSRTAWIPAAMLPFLWRYASEARPYMALLAAGAVAFAGILRFVIPAGDPNHGAANHAELRVAAWIVMASVTAGTCFHMLFVLAVPPLLLMLAVAHRSAGGRALRSAFAAPLKVFALPLAALALFLAFTFQRGTAYDYPAPGLKAMARVLYDLSGLATFGPNGKFSLDFSGHIAALTTGGMALLCGFICAAVCVARRRGNPAVLALSAALGLAAAEIAALSLATGKQVDSRHLAALVPIGLFLLTAVLAQPVRLSLAAALLLGAAWFAADVRLLALPEYRREDYRNAVAATKEIGTRTGARIAIAADPVAAAYYGLDVRGAAPCFPIPKSCTEAFAATSWRHGPIAVGAGQWRDDGIAGWLRRAPQLPVVALIQLDRAHRNPAWSRLLAERGATIARHVHGFDVVLLTPEQSSPFLPTPPIVSSR